MEHFSDELIEPLRNFEESVESIHDVTGVEPDVVRKRLRQEFLHFHYLIPQYFKKRNLTPYVYNEDMIRFYEETDLFIYELVAWNSTTAKCQIRKWILDCLHRFGLTSGKILLCGDGIGVDSLYFAKKKYEVTSFEISSLGIRYATKMFDRYGVNVQLSDSLEALPEGNFDAILCLDVLEHLPDPVDAVKNLAKLLRPGGFFVHHSPFYLVEPRLPTHLKCNLKYSGKYRVFEKAGNMKRVESRFFQNPIVFQRLGEFVHPKPLPLLKKLFLSYGNLMMRIFRCYPKMVPVLEKMFFGEDKQLLDLLPPEKKF